MTESDTSSAMSTLHFKWGWGKRLVSSLLRTVRPRTPPTSSVQPLPPPARSIGNEGDRTRRGPPRSSHISRAKSVGATSRDRLRSASISRMGSISRRSKGKRRADMASAPVILTGRSKSIDRLPMSRDVAVPSATRKGRRGSETRPVPTQPFHYGSAPQSSPTLVHSDDRLRSRFTLASILR